MSEWQKCPVCNGSGLVPFDFYWPYQQRDSTSAQIPSDTCRTCHGSKGYWSMKELEGYELYLDLNGRHLSLVTIKKIREGLVEQGYHTMLRDFCIYKKRIDPPPATPELRQSA